jgi:hypothetical protein
MALFLLSFSWIGELTYFPILQYQKTFTVVYIKYIGVFGNLPSEMILTSTR